VEVVKTTFAIAMLVLYVSCYMSASLHA